MQNVIFRNSCVSKYVELAFLLIYTFKGVSSTNIQQSGTDVSTWRCFSCIWQRSGVVICNCAAQHLRSSNESGKRSRVVLFARRLYMPDARRNFTVHVKFARLLERDREKYQLRSLNEPASLFAPSEFARRNRFRTCFRVEELKSVWSCDRLAPRVC